MIFDVRMNKGFLVGITHDTAIMIPDDIDDDKLTEDDIEERECIHLYLTFFTLTVIF